MQRLVRWHLPAPRAHRPEMTTAPLPTPHLDRHGMPAAVCGAANHRPACRQLVEPSISMNRAQLKPKTGNSRFKTRSSEPKPTSALIPTPSPKPFSIRCQCHLTTLSSPATPETTQDPRRSRTGYTRHTQNGARSCGWRPVQRLVSQHPAQARYPNRRTGLQ